MLEFAEKLHTLLASPYPYLYLVTYEEERIVAIVRQLARAMQKNAVVWRPELCDSPATELDLAVTKTASSQNEILLAIDAHPFLDEARRIRLLRAQHSALAANHSTVVFISPVVRQPFELRRDWALLDVPLPDRSELEHTLAGLTTESRYALIPREQMSIAALGLTGREAVRAFERAKHLYEIATARGLSFDWEAAIISEKRRLMSSASALEFSESGITIGDLGGLEELKNWTHERRRAFSADAREFGLPAPKGLLLIGVQGCGKSLACKAVANDWGLPLVRLDLGSLFSGDSSPDSALRAAIHSAEAMAPCVLWVDEIEKGFSDPSGETVRILGSFLTWLQEKSKPVFFMATANSVDALPPELLRRGRFDEIFFVDLPDKQARVSILEIHLRKHGRSAEKFDVEAIASLTDNFSGAELEQLVTAAMYTAFGAARELQQSDLVDAARTLVPLYVLREIEIKALRTWAQGRARTAGHDRKLVDYFR